MSGHRARDKLAEKHIGRERLAEKGDRAKRTR